MKILTISDEECPALWDYYVPGRLKDYDLIISCGDLSASYLSFLVTMARCPVLYVHGNHDTRYNVYPPEGCDCIDGSIVTFNGLRILGLGGCLRYHPGDYQYTDEQMRSRIDKLRRKLKKMGGVDLVVTHSPPYGVGDAEDPAHHGFQALRELLDEYHPQYLIHGHVHLRYGARTREQTYADTQVINVSERYILDLPEIPHPHKHHSQLLWQTKHKD